MRGKLGSRNGGDRDLSQDAGEITIRRNGKSYRIPVDADGYVPKWALAARFQQAGDFSDLDTDSPVVLPSRCTPEELIEWWINPSSCDVQGIDTRDSEVYDISGVPKSKRHAQRRIAVVAPPEEQARIRRILSEHFTAKELEAMAAEGSFVIRTISDCGDSTGVYYRKQDGVETPLIVLEEGTTEDGVVHELVHHSRAVDRSRRGRLRTTFRTDREGRFSNRWFSRLSKDEQDDIVEEEERMTVAETLARTRGMDPQQSGYYDGVEGYDPRGAYVDDRYIITDTPPDVPPSEVPAFTGVKARNATLKGYDYTHISTSRVLTRDVSKGRSR